MFKHATTVIFVNNVPGDRLRVEKRMHTLDVNEVKYIQREVRNVYIAAAQRTAVCLYLHTIQYRANLLQQKDAIAVKPYLAVSF